MIKERTSEIKDTNAIVSLWEKVFEDDEPYIKSFLAELCEPGRIPLIEEDGRIAACSFLIPCELLFGGKRYPLMYEFAVMTAEEKRGRGLGLRLQAYAGRLAASLGADGICLLPADGGLVSYYKKAGFEPAFHGDISRADDRIIYSQAYMGRAASLRGDAEFLSMRCTEDTPGMLLRLNGNIPEGVSALMMLPLV